MIAPAVPPPALHALRIAPADASFPTPALGLDRDRRRRVRLALERTVKLYDPASDRYFAGHTIDVSDAGFCLELPAKTPARAGQTAMVYVAAADRRGVIDHAELVPVRYVWVRRDAGGRAEGERCVCGVEVLAEAAGLRRAA